MTGRDGSDPHFFIPSIAPWTSSPRQQEPDVDRKERRAAQPYHPVDDREPALHSRLDRLALAVGWLDPAKSPREQVALDLEALAVDGLPLLERHWESSNLAVELGQARHRGRLVHPGQCRQPILDLLALSA